MEEDNNLTSKGRKGKKKKMQITIVTKIPQLGHKISLLKAKLDLVSDLEHRGRLRLQRTWGNTGLSA